MSQKYNYFQTQDPYYSIKRTQFQHKVNVWTGIVGTSIVGLLFIEGTLNSEKYLELLQNCIIPLLTALYPNGENLTIPADLIWFHE